MLVHPLHPNTQASGCKSVSRGISVLPLLHSMGDYVPKVMLEPAVSPQYRCDRHSVDDETTLKLFIIDAHLRVLLSETKLWQTFKRHLSLSVINLEEDHALTI